MPNHPTGVWLTDDGEVVYEQPEGSGTQLVAKGGSVSPAAQARIDAANGNADSDSEEAVDAVTAPKKADAKKAK